MLAEADPDPGAPPSLSTMIHSAITGFWINTTERGRELFSLAKLLLKDPASPVHLQLEIPAAGEARNAPRRWFPAERAAFPASPLRRCCQLPQIALQCSTPAGREGKPAGQQHRCYFPPPPSPCNTLSPQHFLPAPGRWVGGSFDQRPAGTSRQNRPAARSRERVPCMSLSGGGGITSWGRLEAAA